MLCLCQCFNEHERQNVCFLDTQTKVHDKTSDIRVTYRNTLMYNMSTGI